MKNAKKIVMIACISSIVVFTFGSCVSAPPEGAKTTEAQSNPVTAEFTDAWSNAEIRIEHGGTHDMGAEMARAEFHCEWTDGQGAGTTYPQKFVDVDTGEEVAMDFMWDHGGNIQAGVYDVLVDVDYPGPGEGRLRNIPLKGKQTVDVIIDLNATKIEVPLGKIKQIVVFPAGTYADYKNRNMLDEIPEDAEITRYDQYNLDCIAPSEAADLRVTYATEEVEWMEGYALPPNSKVTEL